MREREESRTTPRCWLQVLGVGGGCLGKEEGRAGLEWGRSELSLELVTSEVLLDLGVQLSFAQLGVHV